MKVCEATDCKAESNWVSAIVDNNEAINAALDPKTQAGCGTSVYFASWYPRGAVLAVTPSGGIGVMHYTTMIRQCLASDMLVTRAGFGRVVYLP